MATSPAFASALIIASVLVAPPAGAHLDEGTAPADGSTASPVAATVTPEPSESFSSARRAYSLDHEGSVGFVLGTFGDYASSEKGRCLTCDIDEVARGFSGSFHGAFTWGAGWWDGAELTLRFELTRFGRVPGERLGLGFRSFFGRDEWKTYLDLELLGEIRPIGGGGLRGGFGVMWDVHPFIGIWAEAAATFVIGQGRHFGAQLGMGVQARTWWF